MGDGREVCDLDLPASRSIGDVPFTFNLRPLAETRAVLKKRLNQNRPLLPPFWDTPLVLDLIERGCFREGRGSEAAQQKWGSILFPSCPLLSRFPEVKSQQENVVGTMHVSNS